MILKFKNPSARKMFLTKLANERQDIYKLCRPAKRLPHLLTNPLTAEQRAWLESSVDGSAKAYRDIQFDTF